MTLKPLVAAQPVYAGTWMAASVPQVVKLRRTQSEFLADYAALWQAGYRLIALTSHVIGGNALYSGVWNASTSGQFVGMARPYSQFLAEYGTWWSKGFRLIALDTHESNGTVYFSGVYNPSTRGQFVGLGRPHDTFVAEYGTWWSKGFRLKALTSDVVNGQVLYNGVWDPSTSGQYLRLGRTQDDFLGENSGLWKVGYRVAGLTSHVWNGVVHYGGVWNPSTTGQDLSLSQPQPDFQATIDQHVAQGWRLAAIIGDHVEALDIGMMGEKISKALTGNCVGYSATVRAGAARVPVAGGFRRTTTDSPARESTTSARINVASVAKPITAVAVHQLLAANRLSMLARIHTYLPNDWTKGPNIDTITFQELLTHRSGIRNDQPETYENLKKLIAKGINLVDKSKTCDGKAAGNCYTNANFSLFRIIIPFLNGYVAPATNKATDVSKVYLGYMNQKVFAPAGIATVELKPAATEPTLSYPFPAGTINGIHFGDWTDQAGGAGYHLSSDDLATLLVKLRDGTLLSEASQRRMDAYMLGWGDRDLVRHGLAFSHGGGFPPQPGALNTLVMSFTPGVQVGVEVNSETSVALRPRVIEAYSSSWVTIR